MLSWQKLSLRARLLLLLAALTLTALGGGVVTVWHTDAIDELLSELIDRNVASFQAATELETALLRQKGYVTYYSLDANPEWLQKLNYYHLSFCDWLERARISAYTPNMKEQLDAIAVAYQQLQELRQQVVSLYQQGQQEEGLLLHQQLRQQFTHLYDLCERYKFIHEQRIAEAKLESRQKAKLITSTALVAMPGIVLLGLSLAYVLIRQILAPIRRLVEIPAPVAAGEAPVDEVQALSQKVYHLLEDVDQAQTELQRSRDFLVQSERLAQIGKLAAGVAHSIRNPLTSVKMRLFSLQRHLNLSPSQQEDLEVIAAEIRQIDAIVRNFLEYARPPKLKIQPVNIPNLVNLVLALLRPRLEAFRVKVEVRGQEDLPEIWGDPDQLKEVLVNLIINACEAMNQGGTITIEQNEDFVAGIGRVVRLSIQDTGPGIPQPLWEKIFEPFYTSKEEGTGLGLSIAARIMREHGGWIEVKSPPGQGACFCLYLPLRKPRYANDSDRG